MTSRQVLITAHPDDETISVSVLLSLGSDVSIIQLTDGVPANEPDRHAQAARRIQEREAACAAAGWSWPVIDLMVPGRDAMQYLSEFLAIVRGALVGAVSVWTHPYEGGHLDHDTAAWLVQTACESLPHPPVRMEFASYHATERGQAFGTFWPDRTRAGSNETIVLLSGDLLARKQAALACFASQAHILRKFPALDREVYRVAPIYDFSRPAPPPRSRWDVKGYQPTTAQWRATVAAATHVLEGVS